MFSSGSARTSSVASACAGITFERNPPWMMFGEIDVRSIELYSGFVWRRVSWTFGSCSRR